MLEPDPLLDRIQACREASRALNLSSTEVRGQLECAMKVLAPFIDMAENAFAYPSMAPDRAAAHAISSEVATTHPIQKLALQQLEGGIETASGNFMGYIPGGGILTSALADFVVGVTNRFAGFHFTAPGAVSAENEVISWLCDLLGLGPEAWGSLTSGGTSATLNCLLAARESIGDQPVEKLVIYVSDQVHHAVPRTLKALGLHRAVTRQVPTDLNLRMRTDALKEWVETDAKGGLTPFLAIASAGTTNTGSVDPLMEIARLARRHGVWLHVDAAYGGLFTLCPLGKQKLGGIELADSVVLDPHKGMFLAYGVGAGLVRNRRHLARALEEHAPYLEHSPAAERSPAEYSFELTRHNRAPRIKLSLDLIGEKAFATALEEKLYLAQWLYAKLKELPGLEVFGEPDLSVVTFKRGGEVSTQHLLDAVLSKGEVLVSTTRIRGELWIRCCILSFRTHLEHVSRLVELIQEQR